MAYNWRWEVFLEPAPAGGGDTYLDWIFAGLQADRDAVPLLLVHRARRWAR